MDVQMNPSKLALLYRGLFECFPQWIIEYAKYTPARAYRKAKRINEMFEEIGRDLYHSNADEEKADRDGKRDVMSVLSTSTCSATCSILMSQKCANSQSQRLRRPTPSSLREGGARADAPPHTGSPGDNLEHAQLDALRAVEAS